jgi:PHD/YefM family antitoxin component YafN of YafNO toxin-antitoxin module
MSELKKLEVPLVPMRQLKDHAMAIFELANEKQTGVYVLNNGRVAGVMMTREQYEALLGANHIEVPVIQPMKQIDLL